MRQRLRRWRRRLLAAALVLVLGLGTLCWHDVTHVRLQRVDFRFPGLTGRPLRVMQVSDLHDLEYTTHRDDIVSMVHEEQPDLVAITGDLVNTATRDLSRLDRWFGLLEQTGRPVFVVPGNHDHWSGQWPRVKEMVESHGATVLVDRHVAIDGAWGRLDLVGTDDYSTGRGHLDRAMRGTRPDAIQLVLTHAPEIHTVLAGSGAELALCGHTHGGQVRIPGVGAIVAPGQPYFPHWDRGLYPVGDSWLHIDSGVGQTRPLRLFNQSQVSLVTISGA